MSLLSDNVNHPAHYTSDPSGIECIEITRHRNFNVGNAIKYLWRAGLKKIDTSDVDVTIEDLQKCIWYVQDEINRIKNLQASNSQHDTDNCNTSDQTDYLPLPTVDTFPWDGYPEEYRFVRVDQDGSLNIYAREVFERGNQWVNDYEWLNIGDNYICENWRTWGIQRPQKTQIESDDLNNHVSPTTKIATIDTTKKPVCGGQCFSCYCQGGA